MPKFVLNTPPSAADIRQAVTYGYISPRNGVRHDLSEFAKGYLEAMFFTNGDIGDEREDLLNDLGVKCLTKAAIADIAKDCAKFWEANAADLDAAKELVPGGEGFEYGRDELTDQRLGNLFWYARQGHGVAFTDDGYADCLDRLQDAASAFGEAYVEAYHGWIYHR